MKPLQITITPSTPAPTPAPATVTVPTGGVVTGHPPGRDRPRDRRVREARIVRARPSPSRGPPGSTRPGITPGTDIVRITATGSCGPASAEFTADVVPPGAPRIVRFESIPERGCAPVDEHPPLLADRERGRRERQRLRRDLRRQRRRRDDDHRHLDASRSPPAARTARSTTDDDHRPGRPAALRPDPEPGSGERRRRHAASTIDVDPASVPSLDGRPLRRRPDARAAAPSSPTRTSPASYLYTAGPYTGIDIIRFLWVNGCGIGYTDFTSNVTGTTPQP